MQKEKLRQDMKKLTLVMMETCKITIFAFLSKLSCSDRICEEKRNLWFSRPRKKIFEKSRDADQRENIEKC